MSRRCSAPDFKIEGVTFACFVTDDGHNFEWRSGCGRALAGRKVRTFWARANDQDLGDGFVSLRHAMEAAARALKRKEAA